MTDKRIHKRIFQGTSCGRRSNDGQPKGELDSPEGSVYAGRGELWRAQGNATVFERNPGPT